MRRVCDENSWLKQEIAKLQQILTDTEVELVKAKEEKAQLEILGTVPICVSDGKSFITENGTTHTHTHIHTHTHKHKHTHTHKLSDVV